MDHFLPGFNAGGPIQSIANLTGLLKDTCNFWILTRDTDYLSEEPYQDVASNQWVEREPGIRICYLSKDHTTYRGLKKIFDGLDVDILYCNSLYSFFFTTIPFILCSLTRYRMQKILAPRGQLQAGALQIRYAKKLVYITAFKLLGLARHTVWHATDAQELDDIRTYFGKHAVVRLAANVPKIEQLPWKATPKIQGEVRFAYLSRVSPKKNLLFFIEQLGRVTGKVHFSVYGIVDDDGYWEQCQQAIARLPPNVTVEQKGPVPNHRVLSLLQDYHFFVLSTCGENFGHSIFEALLAGRPVMISDRTPWTGLQGSDVGWDIPLDAKDAWQQVIQQSIDMSAPRYDEMSKSAWQYARTHIDLPALRKSSTALLSTTTRA